MSNSTFTIDSITNQEIETIIQEPNCDCITSNTEILMADGSAKLIQDIQRGDLVAADSTLTASYRVARSTFTSHSAYTKIELYRFNTGSVTSTTPSRPLYITPLHSIFYENTRRYAKMFHGKDGVDHLTDKPVEEILELETGLKDYRLWDLQFETVGSYVANGLKIQSRHPRSINSPLAKSLYFSPDLYNPQLRDDNDIIYDCPLVFDMV